MRKPPAQQSFEIGDPTKTPFVRFDGGGTVFPPNNIYAATQIILDGLKAHTASDLFQGLIKKDWFTDSTECFRTRPGSQS
jgi:hypothetical protein